MVLDKTIPVACAPSRAFALLARPERAPAWQPWTREAHRLDAERFAMVHEVCGMRLSWIGRADPDPVRRIHFAQEEGDFAEMEGTWEVEWDEGQGAWGMGRGEGQGAWGRGHGEEQGAGGRGHGEGQGAGGRGQGAEPGACLVHLRMRVDLPFVLPRMVMERDVRAGLSRSLDEALFNLKAALEPQAPRERAGSGLPRAALAR